MEGRIYAADTQNALIASFYSDDQSGKRTVLSRDHVTRHFTVGEKSYDTATRITAVAQL